MRDLSHTTSEPDFPENKANTIRQGWKLPLSFVLLWIGNEHLRTRADSSSEGPTSVPLTSHPVLTESVKLSVSLCFYFWQRWRAQAVWRGSSQSPEDKELGEEALPLNRVVGRSAESKSAARTRQVSQHSSGPRIPRTLAATLIVLAGILSVYRTHNAFLTEHLTDAFTLYLISSTVPLCIILASSLIASRTFDILEWQSVLMQICGFWFIQSSFTEISSKLSSSTYPVFIGTAFAAASSFTLLEFIYKNVHSISLGALHIILFTFTCAINALLSTTSSPSPDSLPYHLSSPVILASLSQALVDLVLLALIYEQNALYAGILLTCSAALYLLVFSLTYWLHATSLFIGSSFALLGSFGYIFKVNDERPPERRRHWILRLTGGILISATAIYLALTTHRAVADVQPLINVKVPSMLEEIIASQVTCHRKPLPSATYYPHERTYHSFDNVLLIVFFSHARYDVNLDHYEEVYSEFFPNIVFVGPGSREDAGFRHSYDVLVDTYEADEDLSDPSFYRMAGRMAHHMLYTAMREYDCYDGYLWAPFDTLLNIPRLQQFNQDYFWYHSPFGEYVYNPGLGDQAGNQNKTRHAPPANISPDPAINLTATWRGWGPDWWWGEPHVGVAVCMRAFEKVPAHMREHFASLTNGTRLMGGSADTMYIPGRHRQAFVEVLGLFLETDCFLEIATPTVLHLVSPPGEPILFVDHWWIWNPPFNASFVRQKWMEGMEVDTFHTFHWGDEGEDGVWRGEPRHIEDVRTLFAESAARQGVEWTSRSKDH